MSYARLPMSYAFARPLLAITIEPDSVLMRRALAWLAIAGLLGLSGCIYHAAPPLIEGWTK